MKTIIAVIGMFLFTNISMAQKNEENAKNGILKAKNYYEYTKYDSAIILYSQAAKTFDKLKKKEEYYICKIGIGQCFCKKNEFVKALDYFNDLQINAEQQFGKGTAFPVTCIYYQGYASLNLYKFDKAEEQILKALELRKKLYGEDHVDVAQSYNLYGQFFLFKGDYEKSIENFEKSLKIRKFIFGENHADIANSLNNLSTAYYYKGNLDTSIYLANLSLKMKEQVLKPEHPDFIQSYNSLAVYLNDRNNFQEALSMHLKNLLLCQKYYGNSNPITATVYYNIGITYQKLKEYRQALDNLDQALQIRKSIKKSDNPDIASAYMARGNVFDETFEFDRAIAEKKQALKIFIQVFGELHPNTAIAYNSLAISMKGGGDFTTSLEYTQKALDIFNKLDNENNANSAMCYTNIGNIYLQTAQFELCLKYYHKALLVYNLLFGDEVYETALVYNNLGEVYNQLQEYGKALDYFEKAGKIYQNISGNQSEALAIVYKNIGNCYEFLQNYDEAIKNYQHAMEICIHAFGENHLTTAAIYENMAKVYYVKNDFKQSKINTEKAYEIRRSVLPRKHYLVAYSLIDLGLINYQLGNYSEALFNYTFSLESNLNDYTPAGISIDKIPPIRNYQDPIAILNAFKGKAIVFTTLYLHEKEVHNKKLNILRDAFDHIKACDNTIDLIRKSYIDEKDKFAFSASSTSVYDLAINFCILVYLDTKEDKYKELAFYYSEKLKAVTLIQALAGAEAKKFGNVPDSIINYEKKLDRKIANLRKQIAEYDDYSLDDTLFKFENEKQILIKYCETNYPKYFELKYANQVPDVKSIQASLEPHTSLISYYQTDSNVYQIVLTNSRIEFSINRKFENFDKNLDLFRYSIIHGNTKSKIQKYNQMAFQFYELLFPEKLDKEISKLIIVPAGNLANIPFEALLTNNVSENQNFKDYPFLINKYTISYAYSANLYYITSKKENQNQVEITPLNDWLAFAPVFSDESTSGISIRSRSKLEQINESIDTLQNRSMLLNGNYVSPLPGTEDEVKTIFISFQNKNKKAVVKMYQSANEMIVKSDELKNYKYIHFATHGFVNSEKPDLSGILLAQDTTGGNDGILFSGEIYNLDLNANLVTLSACETGLGKVQTGEGIIGLTRALLYAGAKNIIVSLWQVSDEATSKLMIGFYNEMLKSDNLQLFSENLQNSKLRMIKEDKFAHPFFWSSFILIGR